MPPDSCFTPPCSHPQEKRIYDLKKKNQELEKFKFVLDYKIKELKKQIEPRENEIKVMKEQIQEVRGHLDTLAFVPTIPGWGWCCEGESKLSSQPLSAPKVHTSLHSTQEVKGKA